MLEAVFVTSTTNVFIRKAYFLILIIFQKGQLSWKQTALDSSLSIQPCLLVDARS